MIIIDNINFQYFNTILHVSLLLFFATLTWITIHNGEFTKYKVVNGFVSGIFSGGAMITFLVMIAAPLISHPWSNFIKAISSFIYAQDVTTSSDTAYIIPFVISILSLLLLSSILGAIFTLLLSTERIERIILGGVLFGITSWVIFQYFLFPSFSLTIEDGIPPFWLASAFAIYGLILGELIAYKHRIENFFRKDSWLKSSKITT